MQDAHARTAIEFTRPRERVLIEHGVERQVGALEALDPLQVGADRLFRGDPALADGRRGLRERELGQVVEYIRHGRGDGAARLPRLGGGRRPTGGDDRDGGHPRQERPAVELRVQRRIGHRVHALNGAG